VYLELGKENGGVMLNLSEQGCGFQAITPVKRGETRFGFQINGGRRIAGDAEVVWTDDDGVMGGLRFLNLPVEAHREIRTWLEETNAPPEHGYAEVSAERGARRSRAVGADQTYTAPAAPAAGVRVVEEEPPAATPAWLNLRAGNYGPAVDPHYRGPFQPVDGPYGYPQRKSASVWRSIAMVAILVALGVLGIMYQHDVGTSLIWLGETLTGKTKASAVVPDKPSTPTAPTSTLPPSTVPPSTDGLSGSTAASNPDGVRPKPSANANVDRSDSSQDQNDTGLPRDREPAISGRGDRAAGIPRDGRNRYPASSESVLERPGDLPKNETVWNQGDSVEALWGGVQSGSVSAEMSLAERFARGEGVNKNCDQAKVLMKAAADRGNREARLRLYQMETSGCR
jgi:hypothetical protein